MGLVARAGCAPLRSNSARRTLEAIRETTTICNYRLPQLVLDSVDRHTLECNNFNKTKSAEMLGISIKSVHNKVKKYNI